MKTKFFFLLFLIFLLVGLVSGEMTSGSFQINTGGGSIVINSGGCQEDWSGSGYGTCVNGNQIFICFDRNNCGTTNLKPASCGNTQSCTVSQPISTTSGGGGGGGSSLITSNSVTNPTTGGACIENWQCSAFGDCTNGNQVRICTDTNSCGTFNLRPALTQACTTPSTSLFGVTGGTIGAIGNFVKTGAGIATLITLIVVIVLGISLIAIRKSNVAKRKIKSE